MRSGPESLTSGTEAVPRVTRRLELDEAAQEMGWRRLSMFD